MNPLKHDGREMGRHRLKPAAWWAEHFRRDLRRDWRIPWGAAPALTAAARTRIAASIADFQRGESSEARGYLKRSAQHSARVGDRNFHLASLRFVEAENAHADLLRRFMQRAGIPLRPAFFTDGAFRWLRRLGDLGWASRVILIAELVAQEYYPCLRVATNHPVLVRICDQIISEEAAHIRFQLERIVAVETVHRASTIAGRDRLQTLLMHGTALIVFAGHHRVLRSRQTFGEFVARLERRHRRALVTLRLL
ncbi:MAG TPA: ferritin-like domain-containing protein, partial [Opitutaceae bacterium]|nr:ferritin-like domain-containing protein [Opitutaceae bacterium]